MQHETLVLGSTFSEWSQLTEEYVQGMDSLRRREPGASARMMEIARRMTHYQQLVSGSGKEPVVQLQPRPASAPRAAGWIRATAAMLFGTPQPDGARLSH